MIRVLVAEDSPTAAALICALFQSDSEITVVGCARDGLEAVELAKRLRPDLVVMDLFMPKLNGLEATQRIMIESPTPIVIVSGSSGAREVGFSMDALRAGALGALPRPAGPGSDSFDQEGREFVATVKALSDVKVVRRWAEPTPRPPRVAPAGRATEVPRLVAIAASTGGPAALHRLLTPLPARYPLPILVVQHIAAGFAQGFASWLGGAAQIRVKLAEQAERVLPGTAYIAPDGRHLGLADRCHLEVTRGPARGGFVPSSDVLFESVARYYGRGVIAVVLTGMGDDGVEGLRAVKQAQGRVLVQDEATSAVFGMPGAAVAAGLPDAVLPLDALTVELCAAAGVEPGAEAS